MPRTDDNTIRPTSEHSIIPLDGYMISQWSPDTDHACGPTQVHLVLPLDDLMPGISLALRLKSRRAIQELIDILAEKRDGVWPAG